eukprot:TRINITY_DN11212_c0_g1_i1.p2 TRINITY_DN11212_c0_g1~~TRINITY_DN11212_c0_g1_i1.p2  ORF type:complete len:169 (-),score=36.74 TRINITY_DN11212_c0_g1_i1:89-595(-)
MKISIVALIFAACIAGSFAWVTYSQCDPKWGNQALNKGSQTICQGGNLVTSIAMALSTWGIGCGAANCDPAALNEWISSNGGFKGDVFVWFQLNKLGVKWESCTTDHSRILSLIQAPNHAVVLKVKGGKHWVLAANVVNQDINVMDPLSESKSFKVSDVSDACVLRKL